MNERIKELSEQATSIVDMVGPQGYTSSYANFDREKFAELIVRECAELCLKHETMIGPFNTTEFRKGGHFNTIIKHHFGVER